MTWKDLPGRSDAQMSVGCPRDSEALQAMEICAFSTAVPGIYPTLKRTAKVFPRPKSRYSRGFWHLSRDLQDVSEGIRMEAAHSGEVVGEGAGLSNAGRTCYYLMAFD